MKISEITYINADVFKINETNNVCEKINKFVSEETT